MSRYGLATFRAVYFLAVATPGPGVAAVIARGLARGFAGAPVKKPNKSHQIPPDAAPAPGAACTAPPQ